VLVLGLARSGLAAAAALERRGVEVVRVDRELGNDGELDLLDGIELLVKSPGVPRKAPLVAEAERRGVPIWSEVELGYRLLEPRLVGVTGTNGKTTTSELLGVMLGAPVAGNVGRALTDSQRQLVLYWADNPGQTGTPVGHWLAIGSQLVTQRHLTAERAAEVFVLVTLAQADAFIATWHEKYRLNLLRPVTYIHRHIDRTWTPAIVTPPFPEYPSAHSAQSAAAATVLTELLGAAAFEDSTNLALGHAVRRFKTFQDAADEAAESRVYGGIHYPMGRDNGKVLGRCIGRMVLERLHHP